MPDRPKPSPIDPIFYKRRQNPKSDEFKALKYEREAVIVVTPSTTDIPPEFKTPLGAQRFASLLARKGFDIVWTYAKAVQPPTTDANGHHKADAYLIESIAVHGRAPNRAVQVAAVWEKSKGSIKNTMAGYRVRMTGGRVEQHLPGVQATSEFIEENYVNQ